MPNIAESGYHTHPITNSDNEQAIELSRQALAAEFAGQYREADKLYGEIVISLEKAISALHHESVECKRAKLQLRASNERRKALEPCLSGSGPPPEPLPSLQTVQREVTHPTPGTLLITMVELGHRNVVAEAPQLLHQRAEEFSMHPQALTDLLSPALPNVTYYVYPETSGGQICLHVKNEAKTQILYTMEPWEETNQIQLIRVTMSRASEYFRACAMAHIPRIERRQYQNYFGRPFEVVTETEVKISVSPDRLREIWNPRRFAYAGRSFVWKPHEGIRTAEGPCEYAVRGQETVAGSE